MSEIEVGEYIRTKDGYIGKAIENIGKNGKNENVYELRNVKVCGSLQNILVSEAYIKAHSKNIIDLIEVGDMVNKEKVKRIYKSKQQQYIVLETRNIFKRDSKDIKTILTHEQYEQNCYKVGDIE